MKWETEILSPSSYISNNNNNSSSSCWMMEDSLNKNTIWTPMENKLFEDALAKFDNDTPDRWQRVAEMVPGKTVADVMRQYKELEDDVSSIEAGFYPKYRYNNKSSNNNSITSPFTLEWVNNHGFDSMSKSPPYAGAGAGGKRSPVAVITGAGRPGEQERKKGVPWTEEEHKLFLLGLKKYGKGDWRNISRNYVVTRTPTQVASHAQKYFIRQLSGGKDKRRASIHDITTVNLTENHNPLPKNKRTSPEQCRIQWNQPNGGGGGGGGGGAAMAFNETNGSFINSPRYRGNGGFRMGGGGGGGGGGLHEFYGGAQSMVFQMQPAMHYPHG